MNPQATTFQELAEREAVDSTSITAEREPAQNPTADAAHSTMNQRPTDKAALDSTSITAERPPMRAAGRPAPPRLTVATFGPKSVADAARVSETLSAHTKQLLIEQGLHPTDPYALSVAILSWIASIPGPPNIAQRTAITEFTDVLQLTEQSRARCMQWIAHPPDRTTALLCAATLRDAIGESGPLIQPSHSDRVKAAAERVARVTPNGGRAPMDEAERVCVDAIVASLRTEVGMSWFELSHELAPTTKG